MAYKMNLPPLACALLAIGALAAMTGALHEDGLGDTADGFFGASPDRRLGIMKDSRIGTFAALTLIVFVGLKAALLMAIIDRAGAGYAAIALIGCEAASRAGMLAFWHALPSARPGGLSDSVGRPQWETVVCGFGIGLVFLVFTLIPAGGFLSLINALVLATVLLFGFARLCMAKSADRPAIHWARRSRSVRLPSSPGLSWRFDATTLHPWTRQASNPRAYWFAQSIPKPASASAVPGRWMRSHAGPA